MKPVYQIDIKPSTTMEHILAMLRGVIEFPCMLTIYGMIFELSNKNELTVLKYGIEIGNYTAEDRKETP